MSRFAYHGPSKQPHAIRVARLSPEKDFPTLLQATRLVVDRNPDFRLTIVGGGQERQKLTDLTSQLQLTEQVTFLGERRDVPDLLRDASMFVSSTSTEGISLTLLEAMAVGLPIITTSVGGNPEVVEDGVTGHLVPPADPGSLANAICEHLLQRDTWQAMGTLSRSRVERQFDINRMISDYETLYTELTSRN
ncbi:glycosyltransferase [bacterium]|nr:glycosyltransferase [bacterium]